MKLLVDRIGMDRVIDFVKALDGEEAVMVSSFDDDLEGEEFVGADFRKICVSSDSEGYIKMPFGNQLSVGRIYALESLETIQNKQQGDNALKIYEFGQGSATEVETASVIHFNPLGAFLAISGRVIASAQNLKRVNPIIVGRFFYRHERYQE